MDPGVIRRVFNQLFFALPLVNSIDTRPNYASLLKKNFPLSVLYFSISLYTDSSISVPMKLSSSYSVLIALGVLLFSVGAFSIGFRLGSTQVERQEDTLVHQTVAAYFQSMAEVLNLQNVEERQTLILAHSQALLAQLQKLHRGQEIIQLIRYLSEIAPHMLHADVFEQDPTV